MGRFDKPYANLPVWGQHAAVSLYGMYWYWLRFGSGYKQYVNEYLSREQLNATSWREWQQKSITNMLRIAVLKVPYYKQNFNAAEKAAAQAGHIEDIPLLEKDSLREDPKAFLREDLNPLNPQVFRTSGSTGTPIASIWTIEELRSSMALREARSNRWAGVSYKLPRATFSGRLVEPNPESQGPFYRYNIIERQVYFSPFHLRPDTASIYVDALHRHGIRWLTGYSFSYYLLASYILDQVIKVPDLKAVVTTSEKVTLEMRKVMELAFGCRVYEEYSTVENVLFASECESGRLHISPDVGFVEILRPDGTVCEKGEIGEVVASTIMRQYQPFIRFRLGDVAAWDPEPCPCGRSMPVIKEVVGRIEDVVVGPDGRQMVRFPGVFTNQPNVREGQIIQETLDYIRVKVVASNNFGVADELDIIQRIKDRLGTNIHVNIEIVTSIPRTSAGKFKAVISNLPKEMKFPQ